MLVNIAGSFLTFSSYSCPFLYIPEIFVGLSWGYYQAYSSYKMRFNGGDNILNESGLVSAPFLVDLYQKNISNSYIGLTAYWIGGIVNHKYRSSFLMDRVTETLSFRKDHELLKKTIVPYLFRSFTNYKSNSSQRYEDYSYLKQMTTLKNSFYQSYGLDENLTSLGIVATTQILKTEQGALTLTINRDTKEYQLNLLPYSLLERIVFFINPLTRWMFNASTSSRLNNDDTVKAINNFYQKHQDLQGIYSLHELPAQFKALETQLDIIKDQPLFRIDGENGALLARFNPSLNKLIFTHEVERLDYPDLPSFTLQELSRPKSILEDFMKEKGLDSLPTLMATSHEFESLLKRAKINEQLLPALTAAFLDSFSKPADSFQEIKKKFELKKIAMSSEDSSTTTNVVQIKITHKSQAEDIKYLLAALKDSLGSQDEIKIVSDRLKTDFYSELLKQIDADPYFKRRVVKYFDYHPQVAIDEKVLNLSNIDLSIKTIGYNNPNFSEDVLKDVDSLVSDDPELDNFEILKKKNGYSADVVHLNFDKPKLTLRKIATSIKDFFLTEWKRTFIVFFTVKGLSSLSLAFNSLINILILAPLNILALSFTTLTSPLKMIYILSAMLYLKITKADEYLFEGNKIVSDAEHIKMIYAQNERSKYPDFQQLTPKFLELSALTAVPTPVPVPVPVPVPAIKMAPMPVTSLITGPEAKGAQSNNNKPKPTPYAPSAQSGST